MDAQLKTLGRVVLGGTEAVIGRDNVGRHCVAIQLNGEPVIFTVSHALVIRELLDRSLAVMTRFEEEVPTISQED